MNKKVDNETAIAALNETNLVLAEIDYSQHAGVGLENATKDSYAIPFISMLQGLSPQVETVEGAKPGLFINTITEELYKSIEIIPCAYNQRFIQWAPRSKGGGYQGEFTPAEVATGKVPNLSLHDRMQMIDVPPGASAFEKDGSPAYSHLSEVKNHFCLVKSDNGTWQPALISLSSTQIKKSRRWMTMISGIEFRTAEAVTYNPASFSHVYTATPIKEDNAKGSWWGWNFKIKGVQGDPVLYAKCAAFEKQVREGNVEVQQPQSINEGEDPEQF